MPIKFNYGVKNMSNQGSFTEKIISWYDKNKRDLPWRETKDPYLIWLSEIILQQTRVNQGLPYYDKFVTKFPSVFHLAKADISEILRVWQGLGYYSRARNLHKCAKMIVENYRGSFPTSYKELLKLPGIGPYTAAAIASIVFNERVGVVDGNVFRVLARVFGMSDDISSSKGVTSFRKMADSLAPVLNVGEYNQGIMELGAIICTPKSPKCPLCPFNQECIARIENNQSLYPVKLRKPKVQVVHFTYFVFLSDNRVWMKKRGNGIWNSLYDFHLIEQAISNPEDEIMRIVNGEFDIVKSSQIRHLLSHRRIFANFYLITISSDKSLNTSGSVGRFYNRNEIEALPKPILIDGYFQDTFFSGNFDII